LNGLGTLPSPLSPREHSFALPGQIATQSAFENCHIAWLRLPGARSGGSIPIRVTKFIKSPGPSWPMRERRFPVQREEKADIRRGQPNSVVLILNRLPGSRQLVSGKIANWTKRGPSSPMNSTRRLPSSLTPLDIALAALLRGLEPSTVVELSLREALGCVAADLPPLKAYPPYNIAVTDGWALRARDLVGASSYMPLSLTNLPPWVEAGDRIPEGCDCVVDVGALDQTGPIIQALMEAIPGQGVRRIGGDITDGFAVARGSRLRPLDLLVARAAGLKKMKVRRPEIRIVAIPSTTGESTTTQLIEASARATGAEVVSAEAASRDVASIAQTLETTACDLMITIGGSGVGNTDATIAALVQQGEVFAHGIALQPGRTSALGRIGDTPVIALPGAPGPAFGGWLALALPALDRLSERRPRPTITLPLARKIASSVGIAEIALLARRDDTWVPLAVGDLPFEALVCADAWLMAPPSSEGFAVGSAAAAYMLQE
jgi:molybdopterin molybdotransferase